MEFTLRKLKRIENFTRTINFSMSGPPSQTSPASSFPDFSSSWFLFQGRKPVQPFTSHIHGYLSDFFAETTLQSETAHTKTVIVEKVGSRHRQSEQTQYSYALSAVQHLIADLFILQVHFLNENSTKTVVLISASYF